MLELKKSFFEQINIISACFLLFKRKINLIDVIMYNSD